MGKAKTVKRRGNLAPEDRALTPRQKALVDEYLVLGTTQEQAAIKAGYAPKDAAVQGNYVLGLPHVNRYMRERQAELQKKHDVTLDRVIRELAKIGFANMDDLMEDRGDGQPRFRAFASIPREHKAALTQVKTKTRTYKDGRDADDPIVTEVETEFRLSDKASALVSLGKHLGMFPDTRSNRGGSGDDEDGNEPPAVVIKGGLPVGTKAPPLKPRK